MRQIRAFGRRSTRSWAVVTLFVSIAPRGASAQTAPSDALAAEAEQILTAHCAECHGERGQRGTVLSVGAVDDLVRDARVRLPTLLAQTS